MQIIEDKQPQNYSIKECLLGKILIGKNWISSPFFLYSEGIIKLNDLSSPNQLTSEYFNNLNLPLIETIIIGTNIENIFLPKDIYEYWQKKHVGLEIMKTDSACRTYIILNSEGRKTGGIFFP